MQSLTLCSPGTYCVSIMVGAAVLALLSLAAEWGDNRWQERKRQKTLALKRRQKEDA